VSFYETCLTTFKQTIIKSVHGNSKDIYCARQIFHALFTLNELKTFLGILLYLREFHVKQIFDIYRI
jgi:hypothetical protein